MDSLGVGELVSPAVVLQGGGGQRPHILFDQAVLHGADLRARVRCGDIRKDGQGDYTAAHLLVLSQVSRLSFKDVCVETGTNERHKAERDALIDRDSRVIAVVL